MFWFNINMSICSGSGSALGNFASTYDEMTPLKISVVHAPPCLTYLCNERMCITCHWSLPLADAKLMYFNSDGEKEQFQRNRF